MNGNNVSPGTSGINAIIAEAAVQFPGFGPRDFDVFDIPGLEPRMAALIANIRPKLEMLGGLLSPHLSVICGEPIYPHVAKHARRTINPPKDTWVAFANNKRGYKAHPHFQIGLWGTHLFMQFAVIYEAANKEKFAREALTRLDEIRRIVPDGFVWSGDHTVPDATPHGEMTNDALEALFRRLQTVKAAEVLCGIHLDRRDPLLRDGEAFVRKAEETFETLLPLYRMAF